MADTDFTTKQCSRSDQCVNPLGSLLPATSEYFCTDKRSRDGLTAECRECHRVRVRQNNRNRRRDNPDAEREKAKLSSRLFRKRHPEVISENNKNWREKNPDKRRTNADRYRDNNRERLRIKSRQWYADHREEERLRKKNSQPSEMTILKSRERSKQRRINHPETMRHDAHIRRSRKKLLPATFTTNDWQYALDYFHGVCAYCGNPPSMFDNDSVLHQEHFRALSKGGGYTPDNIIPACQNCNISKKDRDAKEWLIWKFGKRKTKVILTKIQNYLSQFKTS